MPRGDGLPDESTATKREILESQERMKIDRWPERDIDWGWFQWLAKRPMLLVNTMLQAPTNAVVRQCTDLLGASHHRFGPSMGEIGAALGIMMAPSKKVIQGLDDAADAVIHGSGPDHTHFLETVQWIETHWMHDPQS